MQGSCPICHEPDTERPDNPHRPFCSKRCQLLDLGRWLDEAYVIQTPLVNEDRTPRDGQEDPNE